MSFTSLLTSPFARPHGMSVDAPQAVVDFLYLFSPDHNAFPSRVAKTAITSGERPQSVRADPLGILLVKVITT